MPNGIMTIFDASTKETLEREVTTEEKELFEKLASDDVERIQSREEARTSALAKLAALGLTEEEIAAL